MSKTRFPAGNSILYPGPTYAMDLHPDDLLRRLAYGERRPMLMPHQRIGGHFFARLLDEMANSHTQLIKVLGSPAAAYRCAKILREELPAQAFGVHVDHDPRAGTWNVLVFHQIPPEMRVPRRRDPEGNIWIGPKEVARVLRLSQDQAVRVIDASGVPVRRVGGRSERRIRQQDLVILANRPRRWRHRTRGAA
jgi:hypothetical protein